MAHSHLLFLAAQPRRLDAEAIQTLRQRRWPSSDGHGDVRIENLHVTVLPIVETSRALELTPTIRAVVPKLSAMPSEEAFDLCFNHAASLGFPGGEGRAPLALQVGRGRAAVQSCKRRLRDLLGDEIDPAYAGWKGSSPHMTLSWRLDRIERTLLEAPVVCTVDEIALIHSHRGEGRYDILARWTLTPFLFQ